MYLPSTLHHQTTHVAQTVHHPWSVPTCRRSSLHVIHSKLITKLPSSISSFTVCSIHTYVNHCAQSQIPGALFPSTRCQSSHQIADKRGPPESLCWYLPRSAPEVQTQVPVPIVSSTSICVRLATDRLTLPSNIAETTANIHSTSSTAYTLSVIESSPCLTGICTPCRSTSFLRS